MARRTRTHGVREWRLATEKLTEKMMRATEHSINDGLDMIEKAEKKELRRREHPPGTRTNSPPGEPPAWVTGAMHDRWRTVKAYRVGRYKFKGKGGNPSVQARIQELGGRTGAGHRVHLPPRPYLAPAVRSVRDDIHRGFRRRYEVVILSAVG